MDYYLPIQDGWNAELAQLVDPQRYLRNGHMSTVDQA